MDPRYIPDDIYNTKILPYFNNMAFRRCSDDKCQYDIVFPALKQPRTIIKNLASIYYDETGAIISKDSTIELCLAEQDEFLFKPAIDTGHGRAIAFLNPLTLERQDIEHVISRLKANFIVQGFVKQHPQLAALNASSLNTIRIISFLFQGNIHISSAILRVGAKGSKIDLVREDTLALFWQMDASQKKPSTKRVNGWLPIVMVCPSLNAMFRITKKSLTSFAKNTLSLHILRLLVGILP